MLFYRGNPALSPADPPINYVIFDQKCNSSSSWFSNKLCYFWLKLQFLLQLILTKNLTSLPADPPISSVIFYKKSNTLTTWALLKYAIFQKKFNFSSAWSRLNHIIFRKIIQLFLQWILQQVMLFFTKYTIFPQADALIKYVIFCKKSNSSSGWFFVKPCYSSQKIQLLLLLIL